MQRFCAVFVHLPHTWVCLALRSGSSPRDTLRSEERRVSLGRILEGKRHNGSPSYSVNRYKPLQNQLLRKPLQIVSNRYKTSYSVNRYKPLQYQSDITA